MRFLVTLLTDKQTDRQTDKQQKTQVNRQGLKHNFRRSMEVMKSITIGSYSSMVDIHKCSRQSIGEWLYPTENYQCEYLLIHVQVANMCTPKKPQRDSNFMTLIKYSDSSKYVNANNWLMSRCPILQNTPQKVSIKLSKLMSSWMVQPQINHAGYKIWIASRCSVHSIQFMTTLWWGPFYNLCI